LGGLDLIVINSGTGNQNENLDFKIEKDTFDTNIIGVAEIADWSYNYLKNQKYGHIAFVSSIAGIRGGRFNPAYSASKAFQMNYCEGLRAKAKKSKLQIYVTDIRPGFVDTAMAKSPKKFWVAAPQKAAQQIYSALKRKNMKIKKSEFKNEIEKIKRYLEPLGSEKNRKGMQRFGIRFEKAYGVNIPVLRKLAKEYKPNHELALELWETKIHEQMLLAIFIDDYKLVTKAQMNKWVKDFASWDICDQCCSTLFDKTPYVFEKAFKWSKAKDEFVKRAGFVMMAVIAVHNKKIKDIELFDFFPVMEREAYDDRNFVKKAVNWSLRTLGKRSKILFDEALEVAERIALQDSKSAKWIAKDALREFATKSDIYWKRRIS
ncbi:MAG: SDR family NAD(P)-dependent oxidoreductase, partial [Ignavibacteriae bacterium]|nr:SDR family NAD(P)-dependent oxidoreductase [Ignavibacteriota bacterium]